MLGSIVWHSDVERCWLYLFLFRHPAAVARSHLAWKGHRSWNPTNKDAAIAKWTTWNRHALSSFQQVSKERVLFVDYDRICNDRDMLQKLEQFIAVLGSVSQFLESYKVSPLLPNDDDLPEEAQVLLTELKRRT